MKTTFGQLDGEAWTEEGLVSSSENFSPVRRISALASAEEVLATIKGHEISGLPLIVEGWHEHPQWMAELFTLEGFVGDGEREVDVRNIPTTDNVKMSLRELVQHFQAISKRAEPGEKQHIYGKDIDCPAEWSEWLENGALPTYIHPFGKDDMFSHLPVEERPKTVMCHLGIGDTMTPANRNPCGSFGHNMMCYTADGGCAIWFMTATGSLHKDKPTAYFQEQLREELDYESRLATVREFMDTPFKVYIAEQRLGDLVLVPPRSCHQVIDHGGITIKMSWRRMGLKSFELSLYDELLIYHRLCRPEGYRVRLNIFHAVKAYGRLPSEINSRATPPPLDSLLDQRLSISSFQDSTELDQTVTWAPPSSLLLAETASVLMSLLRLLDDILVQEWHPRHMHMKHLEVPELNTCSFCGADIFQSFFMCEECIDGETHQKFICCPGCYVEGRTCACEGGYMEPFQTRPFHDLIYERNLAAGALFKQVPTCTPGVLDESPRTHVFESACLLRERRIRRAKKIHSRTHRCCSTPHTRTDPAHQVLATHGLKCGGCREYLCFKHILDLHDVHAVEAIFVHAQHKDQSAWHGERHDNTTKNKAQYVQSGGLPDFANGMAWAASKFRKCSPLDGARAKGGFYDECLLLIGVEDGPHPDTKTPRTAEVQNAEEPIPSSVDNIPAWKQDNRSLVINMRFDSPFTVSSRDDMHMDSRSDSASSRSWSARSWSSSSSEPSTRRRRMSTTSISILSDLVQKDQALTKPSAFKATKPGSSTQVFDCVFVPSHPKKRPASPVPAAPTRPAKKARLVTPETPMSEISSLSFSMTPGDPSDTTASVPSSSGATENSLKTRSNSILGSMVELCGVPPQRAAVNSSRVGSAASTFGRSRLSRVEEPFSKNSSLCLDGKIFDESPHVVASGGYSDVRTGTLGNRTVAIKIMRPFSDIGSPIEIGKLRLQLWREYITWSKLSHPNILECLGFSYDFSPPSCYNVPSLISPWMSNGTVLSYIITNPDADRIQLVAGITRGLEYLHNNIPVIVHGDLRAGNVLVTDTGTPCLTDFGLSRIISETRGMTTSSAGGIAGSLRWMAPELFHERGGMLSVASDVWAYGMTILEIFTRKRPFDDLRLEPQVLHEITNGRLPVRPVEIGLDGIWTICKKCWNAKPKKRPSMIDIHLELAVVLDKVGHE